MQVTTAARTVVDLARTVGFESAVVTMDAALHAGLVTPDDLLELITWQLDWPGSRAAGRAVAFADGRAESVAESRGRVRMAEAELPRPDLQVNIHDEAGQFVGRGDMVLREQHTIGECDGRLKYRAATAGRRIEDVLWEEKRREDALRALGWEVVRFTWADLERSPAWLRDVPRRVCQGVRTPGTVRLHEGDRTHGRVTLASGLPGASRRPRWQAGAGACEPAADPLCRVRGVRRDGLCTARGGFTGLQAMQTPHTPSLRDHFGGFGGGGGGVGRSGRGSQGGWGQLSRLAMTCLMRV